MSRVPATYKHLPEHGLCYVRFWGDLLMAEVESCFREFAQHPDSMTLHKHLVDFSGITRYDSNIVRILEFQAKSVDVFANASSQWLFAYFAPTPIGSELALYGVRAWSDQPKAVVRMCDSEAAVIDVLGLPVADLQTLLANA